MFEPRQDRIERGRGPTGPFGVGISLAGIARDHRCLWPDESNFRARFPVASLPAQSPALFIAGVSSKTSNAANLATVSEPEPLPSIHPV